jgi:CMP/dCMP kinase
MPFDPLHPLAGHVITIDGTFASGKGTLARALARRYRLKYLDTGVVYRVLAHAVLQAGVAREDTPSVVQLAGQLDFDFKHIGNNQFGVWLAGQDVAHAIRTPEVSVLCNWLAKNQEIRDALRHFQTDFARTWQTPMGVVLDGRDCGKNICPDAPLKMLLTADPALRAQRRLVDYQALGKDLTFEHVLAELTTRDTNDAWLLPTGLDVVHLDISNLNPAEVLAYAVNLIDTRFGSGSPVPVPPARDDAGPQHGGSHAG